MERDGIAALLPPPSDWFDIASNAILNLIRFWGFERRVRSKALSVDRSISGGLDSHYFAVPQSIDWLTATFPPLRDSQLIVVA